MKPRRFPELYFDYCVVFQKPNRVVILRNREISRLNLGALRVRDRSENTFPVVKARWTEKIVAYSPTRGTRERPNSVISCQLPVASCRLPVASCLLPVAGYQLPDVIYCYRYGLSVTWCEFKSKSRMSNITHDSKGFLVLMWKACLTDQRRQGCT